jgi:hypothetical protein
MQNSRRFHHHQQGQKNNQQSSRILPEFGKRLNQFRQSLQYLRLPMSRSSDHRHLLPR